MQKAGRSGFPKSAQRKSGSNWTQGMPAGLPCGIPGIGDVMEGAMQQAPHSGRQVAGDSQVGDGSWSGMRRETLPGAGRRAKLGAVQAETKRPPPGAGWSGVGLLIADSSHPRSSSAPR